jgi:hypothetical protein
LEASLVSDLHVESERTLRRHGLIYRIRRVYDETGQPDPIADGEFVENEASDTIPVPESIQHELATYTRMSVDHLGYYRNQHLPPDTCEELRYAREDLRRLADYYLDKWHYLGVIVEIFLPATSGQGLGVRLAQASVWGIESDADESTFRSLEDEQIAEAEAEARETAARIASIPFLVGRTRTVRRRRATAGQRAAA